MVKILEMSIKSKLLKIPDFGRNFRKISILFEIVEKSLFWSKISILVEFSKMSILVEIFENLDLGRNFTKFQFWPKL